MADAPTSSPKLCSICGLDCSNKQRTKDAQGKYICAECIAHAKQARAAQQAPKPAPAAAPKTVSAAEADNAFLLDIPGPGAKKSNASTKPCPSCFKPMEENTLVCMNCGFNTKTGEQLKVRVIKAKEEPAVNAQRQKGYSFIADIPDWAWVLGTAAITLVPLVIGFFMASPAIVLLGGLAYSLVSIVHWVLTLIAAARADVAWKFILVPFYQLYFIFSECENEVYKKLWILIFLTPPLFYCLFLLDANAGEALVKAMENP